VIPSVPRRHLHRPAGEAGNQAKLLVRSPFRRATPIGDLTGMASGPGRGLFCRGAAAAIL